MLDQTGEEISRLRDIIVITGEPLPNVSDLVVSSGKHQFVISWDSVNLFNKRVISANVLTRNISPASASRTDILVHCDMFDKQIVDINGAKFVQVNDLELSDVRGKLSLVAADIGHRGILRRIGVEARGKNLFPRFAINFSAV